LTNDLAFYGAPETRNWSTDEAFFSNSQRARSRICFTFLNKDCTEACMWDSFEVQDLGHSNLSDLLYCTRLRASAAK